MRVLTGTALDSARGAERVEELILADGRRIECDLVVVGIGTVTFPLILTLIGLRARTPEGTATLSAFTQSTGYVIAIAGPFLVGVVHSATGGWTLPLALMLVLSLPLFPLAAYVSRPLFVEDQLTDRPDHDPLSAQQPR